MRGAGLRGGGVVLIGRVVKGEAAEVEGEGGLAVVGRRGGGEGGGSGLVVGMAEAGGRRGEI